MPSAPDLASRNGTTNQDDTRSEDPSPQSARLRETVPGSPTRPQPSHALRPSRSAIVSADTDERHEPVPQRKGRSQYKPGSMSSVADSTLMTPLSSIDLEKNGLGKEQPPKRPSIESKRSRGSPDPEKADPYSSHRLAANSTVAYMEDEDEVDLGRAAQNDNAMKILFFLSGPCVLLSALNTAWACIALVITALSQPIRLCARRPTFGQQLAGLLGPTLNLQLRCIYTPLPPHANEDASYNTFMLVMVHMLSPFLSFFMMFAVWVLAVYWVTSAAIGDPAGQDRRDDGKETVLGLRNWWERWLMRGVKEE